MKASPLKGKRLLLVGENGGSVHVKNYYDLIKDEFDEVLVAGTHKVDWASSVLVNFSIKSPLSFWKNKKKLTQIINDFKPDIIHAHQANSCAFMVAKANKNKIPFVITAWGSDVLLLPKKNFFFKYIVKSCLKAADAITADASFMIDAIKELGVQTTTYLANFGIDYTKISFPEKENIIYSNRLHKELYNIDQIIEGFAKFYESNKTWKLVIGASGNLTPTLKELCQKLLPESAYEFIGFVDAELNKSYYLRAKIWVSVPKSDGTAISLLEAMAYGCVPVVSDLPANKEWIADGENGVIVRTNLEISLNEAIQLNLSEVQTKNDKLIEEKATKKVNRAIYMAIYEKLNG